MQQHEFLILFSNAYTLINARTNKLTKKHRLSVDGKIHQKCGLHSPVRYWFNNSHKIVKSYDLV